MTFNTYSPTQEELLANAPEGATHYALEDDDLFFCWFKKDKNGEWLMVYTYPDEPDIGWVQDHKGEDHLRIEIGKAITVVDCIDNPIIIRNRILEIRKQREGGVNEEQELVEKLASLGFQLIDGVNEKLEALKEAHDPVVANMDNPDNWREGDLFKIIPNPEDDHGFDDNSIVRFVNLDSDSERYVGEFEFLDSHDGYWVAKESLKFHSRPSK